MNAQVGKPGWQLYLLWIIQTFLCVPAVYLIDVVLLGILVILFGDRIVVNGVPHITEDYLAMYIFVPLIGLLTGLAQYGLLRRYLPRMGGWVWATVAGWLVGGLLIAVPGWLQWEVGPIQLALAFILIGLAIGLAQWLLLRRRLSRAAWWILANVAGWGLIDLLAAGNALNQFGLLSIGLLPACATAIALAFLLNRAEPPQRSAI